MFSWAPNRFLKLSIPKFGNLYHTGPHEKSKIKFGVVSLECDGSTLNITRHDEDTHLIVDGTKMNGPDRPFGRQAIWIAAIYSIIYSFWYLDHLLKRKIFFQEELF